MMTGYIRALSGRRVSNREGVVLVTVLILILTLGVMGGGLMELFSVANMSSESVVDQMLARHLAEAGISAGVSYLRSNESGWADEVKLIGPVVLGEGTYEVNLDYQRSIMVATGRVRGTAKKVELQYETF